MLIYYYYYYYSVHRQNKPSSACVTQLKGF